MTTNEWFIQTIDRQIRERFKKIKQLTAGEPVLCKQAEQLLIALKKKIKNLQKFKFFEYQSPEKHAIL